jgi:hypothetical protein
MNSAGSIVIEASIILPFFISFVLVLNSFIQITVAQIALQTAVSETAKQISTHMYPVKLLYSKVENQVSGSNTGINFQRILDQIEQARSKVIGSEDLVEQYASYIPEPIVVLLEWEKKQRELLEVNGQARGQQLLDPLINKAFTKLVLQFTDTKMLKPDHLQVVHVELPSLASSSEAIISIEAQYDLRLPIPFFHHTLSLRKRAVERVWIGSE